MVLKLSLAVKPISGSRFNHHFLFGLDLLAIPYTDFVLDALEQALYARQPERDGAIALIHHSNRGSQYVSIRYSERLTQAGIEPSVGSRGDSYDNAWPRPSTACTRQK